MKLSSAKHEKEKEMSSRAGRNLYGRAWVYF